MGLFERIEYKGYRQEMRFLRHNFPLTSNTAESPRKFACSIPHETLPYAANLPLL